VDNLRLILFISGILVIAAIYAWEVFRERRADARQKNIFDDDSLLRQNSPADKFHVDTDTQQPADRTAPDRLPLSRSALDRPVRAPRDKVPPVEPNAFGSHDMRDESVASAFDEPQTIPKESAPIEKLGIDDKEPVPREMADLEPLPVDIDVDSSPGERDRAEKALWEKARAEKLRTGKKPPEKPSSTKKGHVFALTIMAKSGRKFAGPDIRRGFESVGMRLGEMRIFQHFGIGEQLTEQSVLSAADILEPGVFPAGDLENYSTRGLILFIQLPGPIDGLDALELMLDVGQKLAKSLEGELCDETRSTLTTQAANHLRERIEDMKRRQLI
jgi:cell division protein ZipA